MPTVRIGKYKRPGIYTEEFDSSVIETPIVTGLQTMIIGSSRKGPINTPIYLRSQSDLTRIFGDLDRTLESRGSYFHRTIQKVLEGSPVIAINLLNPDDELDKLEYKSLSTSTEFINDGLNDGDEDKQRVAPYRRFFDTSTFWKRDREAFLEITKEIPGDKDRILHITNLNDKKITVFIVKSSSTSGYNVPLLDWYGSVNDVPEYVDPKDYASDYMVDVVILDGDWTNYEELSVDPTWSRYFNREGLIKTELFNLANNSAVNNLYSWSGLSLIPYFRDTEGTNIFIETRINQRTDRTGLYCAFDINAVESNNNRNLIDLLGASLIGAKASDRKNIDFLSYKDDITETITYENTPLDRPGNTYHLGFGEIPTDRKAEYAEDYISGLEGKTGATSSTSYEFNYDDTGDAYAIIGGEKVELESTSFEYTSTDHTGTTLREVFFIDIDGVIKVNPNAEQSRTGIILGYLDMVIDANGDYSSINYIPVSIDNNGFIYFDNDDNNNIRGIETDRESDSITFEFHGTTGTSDPSAYETYRKWKIYDHLVSILNGSNAHKATILVDNGEKKSLTEIDIEIPVSSNINKTIKLSGLDSDEMDFIENYGLVVHVIDDEALIESGMDRLTTTNEYKNKTPKEGVIGKWSDLYLDYINGKINVGDGFDNNGDVYELAFEKEGDNLTITFHEESDLNAAKDIDVDKLVVTSQNSNFRQTLDIEIPTGYIRPSNVILVNASRYTEVKAGDFLEAKLNGDSTRKMTRILSKRIYKGDSSLVEIKCDSAIKVYNEDTNPQNPQTFRFTQVEDYVSTYKGITLKGFRLREDSLPDGTDERLDEITQIIGKGTSLFNSLVDKDIIDFRYLVDSYGLGLTENSKQVLADICGKRLDTFGILNMPSMAQFRKSSSPDFTDSEGKLSTEFIALGGDPDSSPAFNYSLAEGDGASCVGYFTPYVTVNDRGRPKDVPPAAWIATTFLRKHNSSITSVTPWTIAAGITDGQVTGIAGLEYSFNGLDIENLNGMSVNPIISKRNRGRVIETENTAQSLKTSSLSYIHSREVLIELERDLSDMLLQFQWKYNTPEIRAEIKLRADAICEDYVNRNGLYNFFNKCDAENNTPEIIDHQMGVLDTYVEVIKGLSIIVNNVTILRTGAIDSGGFL